MLMLMVQVVCLNLDLCNKGDAQGVERVLPPKQNKKRNTEKWWGGGGKICRFCVPSDPPPPFKAELFQRIAQLIGKDRGVVAVNEG